MQEGIYSLAQGFLGEIGENPALRAACRAAEERLAGRLRPGVSPDDCSGSFMCAAAWIALAYYRTAEDASAPEEFSMADLRIRTGHGHGAEKTLLTQADTLMAPWCTDEGFAFLGVRS